MLGRIRKKVRSLTPRAREYQRTVEQYRQESRRQELAWVYRVQSEMIAAQALGNHELVKAIEPILKDAKDTYDAMCRTDGLKPHFSATASRELTEVITTTVREWQAEGMDNGKHDKDV